MFAELQSMVMQNFKPPHCQMSFEVAEVDWMEANSWTYVKKSQSTSKWMSNCVVTAAEKAS